jgi:FixJ family two-component response regulator
MSEPGAMVFVVDDEARTRESLKNLMRSVGLHVSWCPSSPSSSPYLVDLVV